MRSFWIDWRGALICGIVLFLAGSCATPTGVNEGKKQEKEVKMAFSTNSTIGDLMADDGARAILEKYRPGSTNQGAGADVATMTLRAVAQYVHPPLTDEELTALGEELSKL